MRLFDEIGWVLWDWKIWFLQRFEYVRHLENEVTRLENELEDPSHIFDSFLDSCEDDEDDDEDWDDDDWDGSDEDDDEDEGDGWKDDWESYYDEDDGDDDDDWDEDEDDIIDTELAEEEVPQYGRHIS